MLSSEPGGLADMGRVHVEESKLVGKPPDVVYAILADPKHHAHILPDAFIKYEPQPDGTVAFSVAFGSHVRSFVVRTEETEKNQLFTETDIATNIVTEFLLEKNPEGTLVTIRTDYETKGSLTGFFESIFAPIFLKQLYNEELTKLCRYALIAQL